MQKIQYIKELKRYTEPELKDLIGGKNKDYEILQLQTHNIIRRINNSQSDDVSIEELDAPVEGKGKFLVFKYVGLIITDNNILCCYPKYINPNDYNKDELRAKFLQVLDVIRQQKKRDFRFAFAHDIADTSKVSLLAIILEIIRQYLSNGLYIKHEQVHELNGDSEIHWERTISDTEALIMNGIPFYPDMYTTKSQWNRNDYFYRLHRCILAECYNYIQHKDLKEMLNVYGNMKSNDKLSDFGSNKIIIQKLKKELASQFVTWKKLVLRLMIAYISRCSDKHTKHNLVFYGTNAFNLVWENVCAELLGNQLNKRVMGQDITLIENIDYPQWTAAGYNHPVLDKLETLKPDTIVISDNKLIIYDAKYYNIKLTENHVSGQPGIESITKQYLYHMAYIDFMRKYKINTAENIFLFPTDKEGKEIGSVRLKFLEEKGNLVSIKAITVNADTVWDRYLGSSNDNIIKFL